MSKLKLIIVCSLTIYSISGCSSNNNEKDLLSILLKFDKVQISDSDLYIFYGMSCKSCTDQIVRFIQKSLADSTNQSQFIFTGINSHKEINHVYGNISDHSRVTVDRNQLFYPHRYSDDFKFPIKLTIKNGRVSEVESLENEYFFKNTIF